MFSGEESDRASGGYRHLNIEDKKIIASCLNNADMALKQIALSVKRPLHEIAFITSKIN